MARPRSRAARYASVGPGAPEAAAPAIEIARKGTASPIFLHSSFRSGSTWLWSKFRADPRFYVFYEFYNEMLADLDLANIAHSDRDWHSHHPVEAPYFLEFAPLLREAGGVRGYHRAMAFTNFFPTTAVGHDLFRSEQDYINLLIGVASGTGRVPVLSCTRSVARIGRLKQAFGGLHLSVRRNLLHQWFSYSNQAANGNAYFIDSILETILADTSDALIGALRRFTRDNRLRSTADTPLQPDDDLFICFIVLHIYLDSIAEREADLIVDISDLAANAAQSRQKLASAVRQWSAANLDFGDALEVISVPMMLFADPGRIDRTVKSIFLMARQTDGADGDRLAKLCDLADQRMATLWNDYDQYRHFSGSAHAEIARLRKAPTPDAAVSAMEQDRAALAVSLREATVYAESLAAERERLTAECAASRAAASLAAALQTENKRLEEERDAALLRTAETDADLRREYGALKAAFDDSTDQIARFQVKLADSEADREATFAEHAAYAESLRTHRDELAAQRDASRDALETSTEALSELQRGRAALEAARDDASAQLAAVRTDLSDAMRDLDAAAQARQTADGDREAVERRLEACARDLAELHGQHDGLTVALDEALRDAENLRVGLAEVDVARQLLDVSHAAAMTEAQKRIALLEQELDAHSFSDPADARLFATRWTTMIAKLK